MGDMVRERALAKQSAPQSILNGGGMVALSFLAFSDGGVGSFTGCGGLLSPLCSGPFVNWRYGPPCFHLFFNRFPLCFNLSLNGGHGSRESIGKAVRPTIERNWNADGNSGLPYPTIKG